MSNEIALREVSVDDSVKLQKVAEGLHQSGLFPQTKGPAGAYAIVQYGYELGLGPMTSLQNINLIQGKPAANGQTMLSLAMSRGITFHVQEENSERCTIKFKRGDMEYTSTFTWEDAQRAGLTGKDNWKKWPTEMLYWRAVAKGVRRIAPEAVMGLYTPEELTHGERTEITVQQVQNAENGKEAHSAHSQPHTEQQAQHSGQHSEQQPKSQNTGAHDPILASMSQLTKLATVMTNLGIEDREAKLNQVNTWLENKGFAQVSSSKELTRDQAMQLIDDLESIGEDPFAPETQEEENATDN